MAPAGLTEAEAGGALAAEACCGFGILAPCARSGERRLRGTGLYPAAALLNHECLPNVARFDAFDAPPGAGAAAAAGAGAAGTLNPTNPGSAREAFPGGNAALSFRALHALPAGEELTCAYFPLHLSLEERQARCREQYGFTCACPRCVVCAPVHMPVPRAPGCCMHACTGSLCLTGCRSDMRCQPCKRSLLNPACRQAWPEQAQVIKGPGMLAGGGHLAGRR